MIGRKERKLFWWREFLGDCGLKISSAVVYPPNADAVRYDVGKDGVWKIQFKPDWWIPMGVRVTFEDGSQKGYYKMPYSYGVFGKKKGIA